MKYSVILNGRLMPRTQEVIDIIRSWHKGELIVSTWSSETQKYNGVDRYVYTDDPGEGPVQNAWRQVVSVKNGVSIASEDVVLRTRCDLTFRKDPFLLFDQYKENNNRLRFCDKRILYGSVNSFNCHGTTNSRLFSPADQWSLGLKTDILKTVDVSREDLINNIREGDCAEQAWFLSAVNKNLNTKFTTEKTGENIDASYCSMINNIAIVSSYTDVGVLWIKRHTDVIDWDENFDHYLTKERWLKLYGDFYGPHISKF